jgi:hypothetical protein
LAGPGKLIGIPGMVVRTSFHEAALDKRRLLSLHWEVEGTGSPEELSTRKIREVLRLHSLGRSQREI